MAVSRHHPHTHTEQFHPSSPDKGWRDGGNVFLQTTERLQEDRQTDEARYMNHSTIHGEPVYPSLHLSIYMSCYPSITSVFYQSESLSLSPSVPLPLSPYLAFSLQNVSDFACADRDRGRQAARSADVCAIIRAVMQIVMQTDRSIIQGFGRL